MKGTNITTGFWLGVLIKLILVSIIVALWKYILS